MPKVLLLTFDAETREARQRSFAEGGFTVSAAEPAWPACLEAARGFGPDVIAVDCGHLPSHCRESAEALRKDAATSGVPLVLFRVAEHDVERTRLKVPGGVVAFDYELIDRIRSAALNRLAHRAAEQAAARAAQGSANGKAGLDGKPAADPPAAPAPAPAPRREAPPAATPTPKVAPAKPRPAARAAPPARARAAAAPAKAGKEPARAAAARKPPAGKSGAGASARKAAAPRKKA